MTCEEELKWWKEHSVAVMNDRCVITLLEALEIIRRLRMEIEERDEQYAKLKAGVSGTGNK